MKKKIILSSVIAVGLLYAADPVPFIFSSGDVIKASEMNSNFQKLVDYISTLELKVSTLESQGNTSQNVSVSTRKFVGISDSSLAGSSGIMALNQVCEDKFTGSSMCTSEEIFYSKQVSGASGEAWVNPKNDNGTDSMTTLRAYNCNGWTAPGADGQLVDAATGNLTSTSGTSLLTCANTYPVSCCK